MTTNILLGLRRLSEFESFYNLEYDLADELNPINILRIPSLIMDSSF